ncbi:MAG: SEL1-like repeat protein [gamma proteobacterium endosymbiont of Lamellibrachia anaximandri]|nr:SEL1-like repeat protein [gamma proteobacterium endosymbiont of Lamellibrachia anaximandri]MBL3617925.1 SEL1-like repeat protein [gamma proteobacterium endosymbiont of Lamellibrachia anaximandri]
MIFHIDPKPFLIVTLLLLGFSTATQANLVEEGARLIEQGKTEQALQLFKKAASAGDSLGAYGLGVLYFQGIGVETDPKKATKWFSIAAENGHAPAQFNLGNAYLKGRGTKQDIDKAEYWWRKASTQGYSRAQFNLGSLLTSERSGQADHEEGIAWFRAAASQGEEQAAQKLMEYDEPIAYDRITTDWQREPLRSESRLLTLPAEHYTIHFLSAKTPETAVHFVQQHKLQGKALLFRFTREKDIWTGVVFGDYTSRAEATATIERLNPSLKRLQAWVRPIRDIQKNILAGDFRRSQ